MSHVAYLIALFVLIALSVPIAAILLGLALGIAAIDSAFPLDVALGDIAWSASNDFILIAVPMFIMMGEILLRSGIAEDVYDAIARWVGWLPGRLMHANVGTSALFAATSGSSVATAATIATVAAPSMERWGYNRSLFLGSIAAGGTLGILIPPSINMIVYGVLSETSVRSLYLAGIIPGIMLALLFSVVILVISLRWRGMDGKSMPSTFSEKLRGLIHLLPPLGLFLVVVGSIYLGVATPTEASALGLVATMGLAAARRRLNWKVVSEACIGTMRTTAMVMLIVIAAFFLNFVMSSTGVTAAITKTIAELGLPPLALMVVICLIYLVLGCFMETLSLMIATTPIVVPVVVAAGYDPVWFGIVFMILIEAALITPPIGVNLFVVQTVYQRARFGEIARGAAPFLLAMIAAIALLIAFPQIAMFLPGLAR